MLERLSKVLSQSGVASRRKAEELIFDGKVKVNGEIVLIPQTKVDASKDHIEVSGKVIAKDDKVYFMLNKPKGFLCTSVEADPEKSVLTLFEEEGKRLFTVGRLDKETEGLIIVTNDGHFANQIIHPSKEIDKEYLVKVDQDLTDIHLKKLSAGGYVEGVFVKPKKVEKVRNGTFKIVLAEGKKREVRILCQNLEFKVRELKRIRIGALVLGKLETGAYREMSENDRKAVLKK